MRSVDPEVEAKPRGRGGVVEQRGQSAHHVAGVAVAWKPANSYLGKGERDLEKGEGGRHGVDLGREASPSRSRPSPTTVISIA